MMTFGGLLLLLIAIAALCVVRTRDVTSQVLALSFYGMLLAVMFFVFQAPDVALSQIAVGAVALPLMVMLAIARMRHRRERQEKSAE
jgi:energy-converting hydrogenase B subunit D